MLDDVKKDVTEILSRTVDVLEQKEYQRLKGLSNQTIHCATCCQDQDSISIAVLIYAIYKMYTRNMIRGFNTILQHTKKARHFLAKHDVDRYRTHIQKLFAFISSQDSKLKKYVEEVIGKAKVEKGSMLIKHGLSTAQAAELMGVSQWDLMSYLGKTNIIDDHVYETSYDRRMNTMRKLFK